MKKLILFVSFVLIIVAFGTVHAKEKKNILSAEASLTVGQSIAIFMNGVVDDLQKLAEYEAPVIISYFKDKDLVVVIIMGSRKTVDGAKKSMEDFNSKVMKNLIELIKQFYNIEMTEHDYSVIYKNKYTKKLMLQKIDGKFLIP